MPFRRLLAPPRPRSIERDQFELALGDGRTITVQRVRDPRARRLRLAVDERGARLTLPPRASLVAGERFAAEHRHWLAEQIGRHAPADAVALQPFASTRLPLRGGEVMLAWREGRYARLEWAAGPAAGHAIAGDAGDGDAALLFTLPPRAPPTAAIRALHDFYEAQARADVGRWLPRHLDGLPRAPRRFRFKRMSSQWGSLAPDATVALDLSLVLARPSAFEYVLVHELCHLLQANHSPAFWAQVQARCPRWRAERDYLRAEGRRLKAGLRALLAPAGD